MTVSPTLLATSPTRAKILPMALAIQTVTRASTRKSHWWPFVRNWHLASIPIRTRKSWLSIWLWVFLFKPTGKRPMLLPKLCAASTAITTMAKSTPCMLMTFVCSWKVRVRVSVQGWIVPLPSALLIVVASPLTYSGSTVPGQTPKTV